MRQFSGDSFLGPAQNWREFGKGGHFPGFGLNLPGALLVFLVLFRSYWALNLSNFNKKRSILSEYQISMDFGKIFLEISNFQENNLISQENNLISQENNLIFKKLFVQNLRKSKKNGQNVAGFGCF